MKKLLVIALAVILVVSAVCVLAACGKEEVVEGEYSYFAYDYAAQALSTTNKYGCKVKVTVKGGVITAIEVTADTASFYNLTATWTDNYQADGNPTAGKKAWMDNGQAMADSFVGLTVEEVNAITVGKTTELVESTPAGQPTGITGAPSALKVVTGATQSSGRLILAVQNALSKLSTAK